MQDKPRINKTRSVVMLAFPGAQVLDITGPMEIFKGANDVLTRNGSSGRPAYALRLATRKGGSFSTTSGIKLVADCSLGDLTDPIDTLLVSGGDGVREAMRERKLIEFIQQASKKARRVASVCSGAFLLAQAGLLDGRRAAAHWRSCELLARNFPTVKVDREALYVRDGKFFSSAGVTAGMDLSLALVAGDYGQRVALEVAKDKVLFMIRSGGQSQFSTHLVAQSAQSSRLRAVLEWALENLQEELTVEMLAARAAMSPRTFARAFRRETNTTPASFIERARIDAARRMLEDSPVQICTIATDCGFGNIERMRRAFHRHMGVGPHAYRERFHLH